MNMEFPLEQETEDGTQHFLMKLRESKLTDDALVESFYDKIIENYDYPENYYIILIHGYMISPESLPTVQKCLMHLMRFMSTSCAVSVL